MKKILYEIGNYFLNKQWILDIVMCFLSDHKKERIQITKLRHELSLCGYDIAKMTDEEIKEGLLKIKDLSIQCGVTKEELSEVLKAMANFELRRSLGITF